MRQRAALLALLLSAPFSVAAQPASSRTDEANERVATRGAKKVEEIVVTARKRAELLEETPISLTALSATNLRDANIQRADELAELVPNLVFRKARTTNAAGAVIRGIGTTSGEVAFDPGIGTYVDGIYMPRRGQILDMLDIERIEVLRGPQGTLFGKNTVGGAISFTTKKPDENLGGSIFIRPASRGQIRTRSTLNIPVDVGWLEDKLFSRLAFGTANNDGWVRNEQQGGRESNLNSLTFLGSLRFLPIEGLTIDISGSWDRAHSNLRGRRCKFQQDGTLTFLYPGLREACDASQPFRVRTDGRNSDYQESYGVWGAIEYTIGSVGPVDDLTVKSITSWREQANDRQTSTDIDATEVFVTNLVQLPGQPPLQQIQQEVQLAGTAWEERVDFIAGYFAFWDKAGRVLGPGGQVILNGNGFRSLGQSQIDNFTWALFAQATVDVTEWASITGGLRYTEDTKRNAIANQSLTQDQVDAITAAPHSSRDLLRAEGTRVDAGEATFTKWTPMVSLSLFAPDPWLESLSLDHLMTYFTYSQGFRGGGFNAVIDPLQEDLLSFGPETIENFELGLKTIGWNERLTLNLSLFHMDFEDIQVLQNVAFDDPDNPGEMLVRRVTTNAAKARSRGLELELQAVPIEGLRITGNVGVLDAKYTNFIDAAGTDRSGNRFGVPKFSSFLALQYSLPVDLTGPAWLDGWITPRIQWSYRSGRFFGGLGNSSSFQRGYNKLDARLTYEFLDQQATIALWGTNLTDERYLDAAEDLVGIFGLTQQFWAVPITWGAELSYRF